MIVKLDPVVPVVWRTPFSVQLGVDPAIVRIDDITATQEKLLAAMQTGVPGPGLTMIAHGRAAELDALLTAVSPVLVGTPRPSRRGSVAVSGTGPTVELIARTLAAEGFQVTVAQSATELADDAPDVAIIVAQHVVPPALHGLWLRRDVAHLPVVFSESSVTIGPLVEPGSGPCLLCLELHRRDADAAWPAIATQLLGRGPSADTSVLRLEAAAAVSRIVAARRKGSTPGGPGAAIALRIDAADGTCSRTEWQAHPECGCRGIPDVAATAAAVPGTAAAVPATGPGPARRRGTGWAAAARVPESPLPPS